MSHNKKNKEELLEGWVMVSSKKRADEVASCLLTPKEDLVISASAKILLQAIRKESRQLGPVSLEMYLSAPEADDHEKFEAAAETDLATIWFTLQEGDPKYFQEILLGGELFLKHVPNCGYCMAFLNCGTEEVTKDPAMAHGVERCLRLLQKELAKCGIEQVEVIDKYETIHDRFKKSKEFKPN